MKKWIIKWKQWRNQQMPLCDMKNNKEKKEVYNQMDIVKETTIDSIRTRV